MSKIYQPALNPDEKILQILKVGVTWANELSKQLNNTEAGDWPERKLVVACLVYAAAMASDTEMDEDSWVELSTCAFRAIMRE